MSSPAAPARTDAALAAAAIALIVLPLVGLAIKLAWPGWMLFFVMMVSPMLLLGYVVQVIIAITGFLTRRAVFRTSAGRTRALTAAWLTAVGIVVTAFFFVDGGDTDWGSAFMYTVGAASSSGLGSVSSAISVIAGIVWVGGWVWLLVEWISALMARRRARTSTATSTGTTTV